MKKAANSGSNVAHPVKINLLISLDFTFYLDCSQVESLLGKLANRSTRLKPFQTFTGASG